MRNQYDISIPAFPAGLLTDCPRNGAHIEITETVLGGDCVFVDYLINGQWSYRCLALKTLENFVTETEMNVWVMDSCYSGTHAQDVVKLNAGAFVKENLDEVITAYLKGGRS